MSVEHLIGCRRVGSRRWEYEEHLKHCNRQRELTYWLSDPDNMERDTSRGAEDIALTCSSTSLSTRRVNAKGCCYLHIKNRSDTCAVLCSRHLMRTRWSFHESDEPNISCRMLYLYFIPKRQPQDDILQRCWTCLGMKGGRSIFTSSVWWMWDKSVLCIMSCLQWAVFKDGQEIVVPVAISCEKNMKNIVNIGCDDLKRLKVFEGWTKGGALTSPDKL